MKTTKFNPGQTVWVVERDMSGDADSISGLMFLAECAGYALVCPFYGEGHDLAVTIDSLHEDTVEEMTTDICVYPICDVFASRSDAMCEVEIEKDGIDYEAD